MTDKIIWLYHLCRLLHYYYMLSLSPDNLYYLYYFIIYITGYCAFLLKTMLTFEDGLRAAFDPSAENIH